MDEIPRILTKRLRVLRDPKAGTLAKSNVLLSLMAWTSIKSGVWKDVERLHFAKCFDDQPAQKSGLKAERFSEAFLGKDVQELFETTSITSLSNMISGIWDWNAICSDYCKTAQKVEMVNEIFDIYCRLSVSPDLKKTFTHAFAIYARRHGIEESSKEEAKRRAKHKRKGEGNSNTTWNEEKADWDSRIIFIWAFRQAKIKLFERFQKFEKLTPRQRQLLAHDGVLKSSFFHPVLCDLYDPKLEDHVTDEQVRLMLGLAGRAGKIHSAFKPRYFGLFRPPKISDSELTLEPIPKSESEPS